MAFQEEVACIESAFSRVSNLVPVRIDAEAVFDFEMLLHEIGEPNLSDAGLELAEKCFTPYRAVFGDIENSKILWCMLKNIKQAYDRNVASDENRNVLNIVDICKKSSVSKQFLKLNPNIESIISKKISHLNSILFEMYRADIWAQINQLEKSGVLGIRPSQVCLLSKLHASFLSKNKAVYENELATINSEKFKHTLALVEIRLKDAVDRLVSGELINSKDVEKFTKRSIIVEAGFKFETFYVKNQGIAEYLCALYKKNKNLFYKRVDGPSKQVLSSALVRLKSQAMEGDGSTTYISRRYLCELCCLDGHFIDLNLRRYLDIDARRRLLNLEIRDYHSKKLIAVVDSLNSQALLEPIYRKISNRAISVSAGYAPEFLDNNEAVLESVGHYVNEVFRNSLELRCFGAIRSLIQKYAILAWSDYFITHKDIIEEAAIDTSFRNYKFSQSPTSYAKQYIEDYRKKCEADILHVLGLIDLDLDQYSYERISTMAHLQPWFLRASLSKLNKVTVILGCSNVGSYRGDMAELCSYPALMDAAMKRIFTDTSTQNISSHQFSTRRLLLEARLPANLLYKHGEYFKDVVESFKKGLDQYIWGSFKSVLIEWRHELANGKSVKVTKENLGILSGLGCPFTAQNLDKYPDIQRELNELRKL